MQLVSLRIELIMRLRTIMAIVFCISAIAPLAIFWVWPHSQAFNNEVNAVRERHLIIANNLSSALDRYYLNISTTFEFLVSDVERDSNFNRFDNLFENLNINHICIANYTTGKVQRSIQTSGPVCPKNVPEERFKWMQQQVADKDQQVVVTGVMGTKENGNVIYALYKLDNRLFIGAFATTYIKQLGSEIAFGDKGHAAIVDQYGRALSHPKKEWEDSRFDMGNMDVVKRMLAGDTGVANFYSPALKEDMIAGYTQTKLAGWGVMVPQPISELRNKANDIKNTALTVMAIGFLIAVVLALFASRILTVPIEQMVAAMRSIGDGELWGHEKITNGYLRPKEFLDARNSIKSMAEKLQENIDTISRHAYLDGVTGLPNRECFRVLAQEEIDKLSISGNSGALLFLDLDGFKQVNDVYGHRAGDDLLLAFSQRLHEHCGIFMKRYARGVDNALTVLPARLGGDEFVVFLGNILGPETTSEFAAQLFSKVFGKFNLHNGVILEISGSVGGAIFPTQAGDFDELLRLADIAMYDAKNSGKGRYCMHQDVENYFENISLPNQYETA